MARNYAILGITKAFWALVCFKICAWYTYIPYYYCSFRTFSPIYGTSYTNGHKIKKKYIDITLKVALHVYFVICGKKDLCMFWKPTCLWKLTTKCHSLFHSTQAILILDLFKSNWKLKQRVFFFLFFFFRVIHSHIALHRSPWLDVCVDLFLSLYQIFN